jgi:hypothetical protein
VKKSKALAQTVLDALVRTANYMSEVISTLKTGLDSARAGEPLRGWRNRTPTSRWLAGAPPMIELLPCGR